MSANARHSKATPRWGTPPEIVAMARAALGGRIELDPMSEPAFNRVVGADRFYTKRDDAFKRSWRCETMLINPAGGLVVEAWSALTAGFRARVVQRAIWVGFSVEQLNVLADEEFHPDDFSKLTLRRRINFLTPRLTPGGAPSHGNYIVGLGIDALTFEQAFAGMGRFSHGRYAINAAGAREAA